MKLSDVARHSNIHLQGEDVEFFQLSTDTRSLLPGDLFVALEGEHFDGHHYVKQAFDKGAVAALVSRQIEVQMPLLVAENTLLALGEIARLWATQFSAAKVAITGSCGKTTLKEMVAAILGKAGTTLFTQGNLNNEIGVPLTLMRLQKEHQFAVVECGANHMGEIAYTAGLVQPDVAIVNNVAPAHLEGFGSVEKVALTKGEIYDALMPDGTAIINLDDAYASQYLTQTTNKKQLTFSVTNKNADVYAEHLQHEASGLYRVQVCAQGSSFEVMLPLLGLHNVRNALAATAIAQALGIKTEVICNGLQGVQSTKGRLFPVTDIAGFRLIDDTYNANPVSICAAIDVLAEAGANSCLVLGGMGELGECSNELHQQVGEYAAHKNIASVYGLGEKAQHYQKGYVQGGQPGRFTLCVDHESIARHLAESEKDKLILIKGSRSTAMENVIAALRNQVSSQEGIF